MYFLVNIWYYCIHFFKEKINFLPNFKNPCWYEDLHEPNVYQFNKYTVISRNIRTTMTELMKEWAYRIAKEKPARRLRCLPYFLIIGQPKCGTTDVYRKIVKHPDVINPPIKELHWWSRNRQGMSIEDLKCRYILLNTSDNRLAICFNFTFIEVSLLKVLHLKKKSNLFINFLSLRSHVWRVYNIFMRFKALIFCII